MEVVMFKQLLPIVLIIFFVLIINPPVSAQRYTGTHPKSGKSTVYNTTVGSFARKFIVHLPADYNSKETYPLLLCFHGNGGTGKLSEKAGFSDIADREGFIVVYPYGINKTWNLASNNKRRPDDVRFVKILVKYLISEYAVDESRVYAMGHSVGGFLSIGLAVKCSKIFAAVASVSGGCYKQFAANFAPVEPVSILLMHGTKDNTVPFRSGQGDKQWIMDTLELVDLWVMHNGCNRVPSIEKLPDIAGNDGTTVMKTTYSSGKQGTEVVLYTIKGGKHRLPSRYKEIISYKPGHCRDIDAAEEIWKFFSNQKKAKNSE
jgi:polyhydroxybutyrate depolymerase